MEDENAMLERIFTYHTPTGDQVQRYQRIRDAAREFSEVILEETGDAYANDIVREVSLLVMQANAKIAQHGVGAFRREDVVDEYGLEREDEEDGDIEGTE